MPPHYPPFKLQFGESLESLNTWDRIVLLGGGIVVGYCLGVSTLLILMQGERQLWALLVICLTNVLNFALLFHTARLSKTHIQAIEHLVKQIQQ